MRFPMWTGSSLTLNGVTILSLIGFVTAGDRPIVETSKGLVQGKFIGKVSTFFGIPFAKPPAGDLRFKPPQATEPWNGTLELDQTAIACPQMILGDRNLATGENCLTLSVYSLNVTPDSPMPVLVWLHGGNFETGSSSDFLEEEVARVAERGIVIVIPQFRLNFLGFFTTHSKEFPPNRGLKDQVQALKWVQEEIHHFGGDRGRITLGGHGSGAAAASLHAYSPLSRGLFHQAILMSGSAIVPWAVQGRRGLEDSSKRLAVAIGCVTSNQWERADFSREFKHCIENSSDENIRKALIETFNSGPDYDPLFSTVWGAVVEEEGKDAFLPFDPISVKNPPISEDFKAIIGFNTAEAGHIVLSQLTHSNRTVMEFSRRDFDRLVGALARPSAFQTSWGAVRGVLSFHYAAFIPTGNGPQWASAVIQAASDYRIAAGVAAEAERISGVGGEVFLYSFPLLSPHVSEHLPYKTLFHGAELDYFLPLKPGVAQGWGWARSGKTRMEGTDAKMKDFIQTTWTDFIKTKNSFRPSLHSTSTWDPITKGKASPALLLQSRPRMSLTFPPPGVALWNDLMPLITHLPCRGDGIEGEETPPKTSPLTCEAGVSAFYFWLTWLLLFLLIASLLAGGFLALHYRKKLQSYSVLRRIEELSFI